MCEFDVDHHNEVVVDGQTGHRQMSRRQTLDMLAAGGLFAMLGPLFSATPSPALAADDDVVRIGYLPITDATALLVAYAKGFFADEGLQADPPTLIRAWSPLVEGFAAGKFNLVHMLKPIPVWMRYNNHFPVKIMAWAHTNGSGLVVGKDTKITSFADLGGKQVAVPYWYSMHNVLLQWALRQSGVTPVIKARDETLGPGECNLQVMSPPDMPPALAAGKLDAYIVAEPFNALGELKAGARMLRFTGDIWKNHPCCVVCMHEEVTTKKQEWTQKVINAVVRGAIFASANKTEVAQLLSNDGQGFLPVPATVVERAMTLYDTPDYIASHAIKHPDWDIGRIDFNPWPYPSATQLIVKGMNETLVAADKTFLNGLDPEFVAKDLVNYDFVRNALQQYAGWKSDPSVSHGDPFTRTEVLAL